ncbi:MAG: threonylcarbamoyl-AMP synthase [Deltaproteobacteria bacterium]|nr:threonylcarbamoyl-AMP synthase [Deltaproteobacteria bacterium]
MLIAINHQNPQGRLIKKVSDILKDGGIVIYPTDTAYGIGCDLFNKKSIERVYQIARRPKEQPLSFICHSLKEISVYANVSNFAYRILKRHLPGPYTFILEATRVVPKIILPKRQTVGIRIPDNNICLAIVEEFGHPLISATVKGENGEPLNEPSIIQNRFGSMVEIIVDGGIIPADESTVISLLDDELTLMRKGKGDIHASYKNIG